MIYVFEDSREDPIQQLFGAAYDREVSDAFVYTNGNGNITRHVEHLLSNTGDVILVYLDTVPSNLDSRRIYYRLANISKQNSYRVVVLPILCSEYYFIQSIKDEGVILSQEDLDICTNLDPYFASQLLVGLEEQMYCNSYERFCKLVLMKQSMACVRNVEYGGVNKYFRWYYTKDCRCSEPFSGCNNDKSIMAKSVSLLKSYPCVPFGIKCETFRQLDVNGIWNVHRRLVSIHNILCERLKEAEPDVNRVHKYKLIKPIK